MKRVLIVAYGAATYLLGFAALVYAICFVGSIAVPRSIDHDITAPLGEAIAINLLLVGLFGVQHSVMARPAFKRWWTSVVPHAIERSTYVLASAVVFFLLFWQWRTMPTVIWDVTWTPGRLVLEVATWLGWAIVLASTFMINHFELFGLRQVYLAWRGQQHTELTFRSPLLYRLVRHPLMLGFLIAFWATPRMTAGHLLFSAAMTGYILIALQFEERDLVAALGDQYRDYRRRVPMLFPWRPRRQGPDQPGSTGTAPVTMNGGTSSHPCGPSAPEIDSCITPRGSAT
jgi:methanethiol S-methyltransferase